MVNGENKERTTSDRIAIHGVKTIPFKLKSAVWALQRRDGGADRRGPQLATWTPIRSDLLTFCTDVEFFFRPPPRFDRLGDV